MHLWLPEISSKCEYKIFLRRVIMENSLYRNEDGLIKYNCVIAGVSIKRRAPKYTKSPFLSLFFSLK